MVGFVGLGLSCACDLLVAQICGNTPVELDSAQPPTTPKPPLALELAECDKLMEGLTRVAQASIMRRQAELEDFHAKPDVDELEREAFEDDMEAETSLMTYLVDAFGYMLKAHRAAGMPLFNKHVVPLFGPFLRPEGRATYPSLFFNAMCLFVDSVEWCGAEAHRDVLPVLMPVLLDAMTDVSLASRAL